MTADAQLLRDYAEGKSQDAFTELVRRHLDLVHSAALRQIRSPQLAEEISQSVFTDLARAADKLKPDTVLTAWLYQVTRRTAIDVVRRESRRQARERLAVEMAAMNTTADWAHIEPLLDDAMETLDEPDRAAILLRYFENKSLREVGQSLGASDDAAQKRVSRAVDRLRDYFSKRGVAIGAGGLVVLISANAVQSAPVALAATLSTATAVAGTTIHTSTIITATKVIAMTVLQKTAVAVTVAVLAGTGIYEAHQASQLRAQVQTLQQQQTPLVSNLAKLEAENKRLSNLASQEKEQKSLSHSQFDELLKLRGQAGQAQTTAQELAKLKSAAQSGEGMPSYLTNAVAVGMAMAEKGEKKNSLAKLARMKEQLHLTDNQEQAISDIMLKHIADHSQHSQEALDAMMHHKTLMPEPATAGDSGNEEAEIKSLLTPDQLAAYPGFNQSEVATAADNSAKAQLAMMTADSDLSQEQQDKARAALYQLNLNEASTAPNKQAIAQARASGNYSDVIKLQIDAQKQSLEEKLKALDGILTPEQLATYKQKQMDTIDMLSSAMKAILPQTNAAQ
jgi:RNA polymerase sigma factor (sigma-70 family)